MEDICERNEVRKEENETDDNDAGPRPNKLEGSRGEDNPPLVNSISTQTEWSWLEDLIARTSAVLEAQTTDSVGAEILNDNNESSHGNKTECVEDEIKTLAAKVNSPVFQSTSEEEVIVLDGKNSNQIGYDSSDTESESLSYYSEDEIDPQFPSVGPPQMLQHLRESLENLSKGKSIKSKNGSDSDNSLQKSFFSGPCQFCGQSILPLPTVREIESLSNKQLYCCYEYEDFMKLYISYEEKKNVKDEVIDIKPHAPYGTKAARKAAKERAAERMREKEMERQKTVTAQANFFSFNRQVKTVQYALSSVKCMEEGWTLRPQTPIEKPVLNEADNFSIEVNSNLLQNKNELYQKFYDDGSKFLVIYPDGTGCCYYPSGNVAVMIVAIDKGKYTYILQKDSDDYDSDDTGILGIFEPNGNASCYFKNGALRLLLTSYYGIQTDKLGNYKKKWQWYFIKGHVHTPPFQPICFSLNKELSCRVMEQHNVIISFTSGQRAVRFKVGARLKAHKNMIPPISRNDDAHYLESVQKKVQSLVEKINLTMRFPKSPKLEVLISKDQKPSRKKSAKDKLQLPKLKGREPSVIVN